MASSSSSSSSAFGTAIGMTMQTRSKAKQQRIWRILAQVPIESILDMCKPLEREAGALVDTAWRDAEQKSRQTYYFPLCAALPTCPPLAFSTAVDWRSRYFGVKKSRQCWKDCLTRDNPARRAARLKRFCDGHKVIIVGSHKTRGETQRLFHQEATVTLAGSAGVNRDAAGALVLDLLFREPIAISKSLRLDVDIWFENSAEGKLGLFYTAQDVLCGWQGFRMNDEFDLVVPGDLDDDRMYDLEAEPIQNPDEGFHGGHSHFGDGFFDNMGIAPWLDTKRYEVFPGVTQYAFRKPPIVLPDLEGIDDDDEESIMYAEESAINQFYDQPEHLARLNISFRSREARVVSCCGGDFYKEPTAFNISHLEDALINMDWI